MKKPAQAGFFMPAAFVMRERTHCRLPDSQKLQVLADMPLYYLNSLWLKKRRTIG
ncbi:hypothetical protein [Shigella dysenteriae]|uniref:Transposase n=1 Tax=Shigella dysenteriae WRSd3 TaxID=1401327 RepID=A0A090NXA7_SHIDY|nr:hypothetical protein [Shigella dysenteriae]ESU79183.1 hypothetical protein WRSd3_02279 [Shigella dysenteriae WRSd3]ESU84897.1 hypothetical protein WRSd5_00266 [Shigella dysenteriae WRSd5]